MSGREFTLFLLREDFSVCRLSGLDGVRTDVPFTFLSITPDEISLVCPTKKVPATTEMREDGWRAFRVDGVLDFALIGILSQITGALAKEKISVFAISTYNTDYCLVRAERAQDAVKALRDAGYSIAED